MPDLLTQAKDLNEQRRKAVADARAVLEDAEKAGRDFSDEDRSKWDSLFKTAESLRVRRDRLLDLDKEERADAEARAVVERGFGSAGVIAGDGDTDPVDGETRSVLDDHSALGFEMRQTLANIAIPDRSSVRHRRAWKPEDMWDPETQRRKALRMLAFRASIVDDAYDYRQDSHYRKLVTRLPDADQRALQADIDTQGGYLYPPMEFVQTLIKNIDDMVWIRQWATVETVMNADELGMPSLDTDPDDAEWTAEVSEAPEDTSMRLGRRVLHPYPMRKLIKISRTLLRKTSNGAENLVRDRFEYKFGVTQEKGFLVGTGANQALGCFVASSDGISTSRDMATDNEATAVVDTNLVRTKYKLKSAYWPRAKWLAHPDFFLQVALLKSEADGQFIWRESVRAGEPDRLLNMPVYHSQFAPNTFTSGQYVAILGDFSNYMIADSLNFEFQRLNELYARTNQVGYIGQLETDGMPVKEEAFVRVKLG